MRSPIHLPAPNHALKSRPFLTRVQSDSDAHDAPRRVRRAPVAGSPPAMRREPEAGTRARRPGRDAGSPGMRAHAIVAFQVLQVLHTASLQAVVPRACSRYTQIYSGCAPTSGPQTHCGNVTKLYNSATVLPNGTVAIGKRFHWETRQLSKLAIAVDDPVSSCARACEHLCAVTDDNNAAVDASGRRMSRAKTLL